MIIYKILWFYYTFYLINIFLIIWKTGINDNEKVGIKFNK